ncbi:MAG: hypothetical protein LIO68_01065 [Rikenellaceae bacterium]|nr:hypothetical protein [Rikenellaceae bacterium]
MNTFLLSILLGLAIGLIDVIPMIIQKLPRHTNVAAFIHYFVATVVIVNIDLPGLPWWIEGAAVGLALMIPTLIHVAHEDRKPLPVITANAIILGEAAAVAAHFLK